MAGTADLLAVELARMLSPARERLETGQVPELFHDLGLPLPQGVVEAPAVAAAISDATAALAEVPGKLEVLVTAIKSGDTIQIAAASAELLPLVSRGFDAVRELAVAVKDFVAADTVSDPIREVLTELPQRLVEFCAVTYLLEQRPTLGTFLALTGLIDNTPMGADGDRPAYVSKRIRFDRLEGLLQDPAMMLEHLYQWGSPTTPLDAPLLLGRLRDLLKALGVQAALASTAPGQPPELSAFLFRIKPADPSAVPTTLLVILDVFNFSNLDIALPIGRSWDARLRGSGILDLGAELLIEAPATLRPQAPAPGVSGELTIALNRTPQGPGPVVLFGSPTSTRLTAASLNAAFGASFTAQGTGVRAGLEVDASVSSGKMVITFGGADGFLSTVLPGAIELDFDLGIRWSEVDGLTLKGGAGLMATVPLALTLGPLRLDRVDLAVRPGADGIALDLRIAGDISLGPFGASVEGTGAGVGLALKNGNLGPVDLSTKFLPPTGLGLSVDAGPVNGGGFIRFNEPAGRYSGSFEVKLGVVGVEATALLDTRMPGGQRGFALLVLMRASFPPIQLGFGFALSAVGGLIALNRHMDIDALRNRLATGTAGRILAPEDPVRNAPVLLSDLAAVFPPAEGVVVVGPTLQLSWAELVRFDIGIFIELPGPRKVVMLGSARAGIDNPGGGRPYLQIRLDILGVLDFAAQSLSFDAVLIDSHLLEILELTGGAAFRMSWGAEPFVVLTVGGFHPAYSPAPLVFPSSLTRIAMVRGTPKDFLYFRFEGYFAITTNTLQFGAAVEVIISLGSFNIRGFLGFDALIQFQPFHFEFSIAASVKVRYKKHNLGGLTLRGKLSGPGPVVFRGKVCFEILWFDICFEETFKLGSSVPPAVTPVESAVTELTRELEEPGNIRAIAGTDNRVVVEPAKNTSLPVVSPLGQATWTQERAPLDLLLQRFEGAPLTRAETVTAAGPLVTGQEVNWFAPGSFTELVDADALNRRAFERLHGGVRISAAGTASGPSASIPVRVKQIRLPAPLPVRLTALAMPAWLLRATAGRIGAIERDVVIPALTVRDEAWKVHAPTGGVVADGLSQTQAHQLAKVAGAGSAVAAADVVPAMAF